MPGKAIVSVINDLSTDQRVHRTCTTLARLGYEVVLVGRKLKNSLPITNRSYATHRMNLIFSKGPLFYAEYHFRLWLFLLVQKPDLLFANDLDTLLPNYLISRWKKCRLIYDAHEYFTEVPELQHTPLKKKIWKSIERFTVPKLKQVITVNDSIARLYREEYKVNVSVVRNVPFLQPVEKTPTREELNIPPDKKLIILQGAGINIERGAEELVAAMEYLKDMILLIIGGGDVIETLKNTVRKNKMDNIIFLAKQPATQLAHYTRVADLGVTLDKDTNINYRYSLPNKLFDYIHAGIPVLASPLVEVKKIITEYQVGEVIEHHAPKHIADKIRQMLSDVRQWQQWKENTKKAATELCWEKEEKVLKQVIEQG